MPRYFFIVEMPDYTYDDPEGAHLANEAAARNYGARVIRELRESGFESAGATLHVRDEGGHIIQSIPFAMT